MQIHYQLRVPNTLLTAFLSILVCSSVSNTALAVGPTAADVYAATLVRTSTLPQSVKVVLEGADADLDTVTYAVVTGPSKGTLSTILDQSVTYTPNIDFVGSDSFTYKATTSSGSIVDSPIKTATIRIFAAYLDAALQQGNNIDGEDSGDESGQSVSLSSNGSILAVGAPKNDGAGSKSGHVRVYERNSVGAWTQLGTDIDGEAASDEFGSSVVLSSDGHTLAVGGPINDGSKTEAGHVRIYGYDGSAWAQLGDDINGEASQDDLGRSISLSSDGRVLAIGAPKQDGVKGYVRIYKYGSTWTRIGDIYGEDYGDQSGQSVSLSSNGSIVAVGAPTNRGGGYRSGHVRVYERISDNEWVQLGADIDGEAASDESGSSVALSSDGYTLAVGAPKNDMSATDSGHVRIYGYDGSAWAQIGADIDGEAEDDKSGYSVSLSSNGLILAAGGPGNNTNQGHVRLYKYDGSAWSQLGADINGEVSRDNSGHSVALSGDGLTMAVGAPKNNGNGEISGHVRVYQATDITSPMVILTGTNPQSIEKGTAYGELGATASDNVDGVITNNITVNSTAVDVDTEGSYTVIYTVSDAAGNSASVNRIVTITPDVTNPVITLTDGSQSIELGSVYTELGATASDNINGDITASIDIDSSEVNVSAEGSYTVSYTVSDTAGNTSTANRIVTITPDVTNPVITLTGGSQIIELGSAYSELGATASDNINGDITASIDIDSSGVNVSAKGNYTVSYTVSDAAGNTAIARRVVTINADEASAAAISEVSQAAANSDGSGVSINDLNAIAGLNNQNAANLEAYQAAIAAANNAAASDLGDVANIQALINEVNLLSAIGAAADNADITATFTEAQLNSLSLVGVTSANAIAYNTYIDANADFFSTPVTSVELQSMVHIVNVIEASKLAADPSALTDTLLQNAGVKVNSDFTSALTNAERIAIAVAIVSATPEPGTTAELQALTQTAVTPLLTLIGNTIMSIEQGTSYNDPGATASDLYDSLASPGVVVGGDSVNTNSVGTYTVTYNVSDEAGNAAIAVIRTVNVVDTTAPVIIVVGGGAITHEQGTVYTDTGVTATDALSAIPVVTSGSVNTAAAGDYVLTYTATDSSANSTTVTRTVTVADSIGPVITLIGDTIMVMEVGNIFADAGAMATDTVDGDLTSTILVTGVVDTSAVGAYTLRYTVSDMSNNEAIAVTRTVIVEAAPVSIDLVIPDDLSVNATGFLTGVNLDPGGAASAISSEGNILDVVPDQAGPFYSGSYEILWSATTAGITVSATQSLKVVPVVNLATAITVTEGNNLGLAVMLSGQAADYPVIVPFTVGGTAVEGDDYSVDPSGSIIITEGTMGTIRLNILEDAVAESQETVIITLGDVTNAALGVSVEQVINIVEVNLPPKVTLAVSQADLVGSSIAQDQGVATVKVDISDANAEDTHTVDWSSALLIYPEASVVVIEGEGSERPYEGLEFDPVDFSVGVYTFVVVVSDGTDSVSAALNIKVLAQAPVLSEDADSDGDGISDAKEGAGDSDGDGIPDYEDNIAESNLIPSGYGDAVVASEVGSTMILGSIALGKGDNDITVTEDEIAELIGGGDADYDFPAGLLDFVLTGAEFGHSYMLIVPLSVALPEGAVYRKFSEAGGWTDFVENATNTLSSAIAVEGTCPELGSDAYALGLTEGNNCVQLVIEEGGPNDADGLVNGTLVDPGGFAVEYFGPPSELSQITLSRSQLTANGRDSATITIVASDVDGRRLENIIVSASVDISGVSVGSFIALGNGIYTASLIAGNVAGSAAVVVVINDGEASISLISDTVTLSELVVQPPGPGSGSGGGCAVATDGSHDASLLLLLMIAGVLVARRRHQLS